jgi:hypothetical protein
VSTDKPADSQSRPDQASRPERKPFPGQSDNRPPVPPPADTKTADELRADRARYKTTSEYTTAKAAEKAEKTAASQVSAGPGGAPARGDSGVQRPADADDRGSVPGASPAGSRRPESLRGPDRIRHTPFPGHPDNRPPVPPPADTKTADELRADRARYKTTSEYTTAKAAGKAAAPQAAAKETPTGNESAAGRSGSGTHAERDPGTRDQRRTGSGQAEDSSAQVREPSRLSDKANATPTAKREPADDKHTAPPAQPDKTSPAGRDAPETQVEDGPHPPGHESPHPSSPAAQRHDKGGILHGHSEFRGRPLDVYTDGTRWVGRDAVQAAREEAARARAEGHSAPQRHGIIEIPQMRDLGSNTIGEKENRSPGDTSDLPPSGQDLPDMEDKDAPRVQRFANKLFREFGDFADAAKDETDYAHDALTKPMPTGHAETAPPAGHPVVTVFPSHTDPGPGAIVEAALVTGLVMFRTVQAIEHKVRHDRRSEADGGH